MLRPTAPWEKGWARPRPGGLWWEPEAQRFRVWYQCGCACSSANPGSVGDCNSICVAESPDGVAWHKPNLTASPQPGTNIVFADPPVDTATVWRDEAAPASERYKLAIIPTDGTRSELPAGAGYYQLYSSADGISWRLRVKRTGPTEDGDTMFYNVRQRTVRQRCHAC